MVYSRQKWSKELTVTTKYIIVIFPRFFCCRDVAVNKGVWLVLIVAVVVVSGQLGTLMMSLSCHSSVACFYSHVRWPIILTPHVLEWHDSGSTGGSSSL